MRAWQILSNYGLDSHPFEKLEEAKTYIAQRKIVDYIIQEVEISMGDRYRVGNTIYLKDSAFKGVARGVYYPGDEERI